MVLIVTSGPASALRDVVTDLNSAGLATAQTTVPTDAPGPAGPIDLVILDPTESSDDPSGVVREIRALYRAPILVVSRRLTVEQRVALLEEGADQLIEAPYDPHELVARVNAIRRRYSVLAE